MFLQEKFVYYRDLTAIVEIDDRLFKTNANEVFKRLKDCVDTIKKIPKPGQGCVARTFPHLPEYGAVAAIVLNVTATLLL